MAHIERLFRAFLAPAIFVSAASLLILSINVRLMGIVSRLRQFVHARHNETRADRLQKPKLIARRSRPSRNTRRSSG